jgi:hypothetical protein
VNAVNFFTMAALSKKESRHGEENLSSQISVSLTKVDEMTIK